MYRHIHCNITSFTLSLTDKSPSFTIRPHPHPTQQSPAKGPYKFTSSWFVMLLFIVYVHGSKLGHGTEVCNGNILSPLSAGEMINSGSLSCWREAHSSEDTLSWFGTCSPCLRVKLIAFRFLMYTCFSLFWASCQSSIMYMVGLGGDKS